VKIRRVTAADGPLLRGIRLRALRTDPASFGSTYEREQAYTDARWNEWAAEDAVGDDDATFLALEGRDAVGIVVGARREEQRDVFDVFAMWVAPEARRRGIARALLAAVESWMISAGGRTATLSVTTAAEPARMLYESAGYEPAGWSQESRHTRGLTEVGLRKPLKPIQ
jgi:ribosomal protein S18 acetylase RimI-like enzyme